MLQDEADSEDSCHVIITYAFMWNTHTHMIYYYSKYNHRLVSRCGKKVGNRSECKRTDSLRQWKTGKLCAHGNHTLGSLCSNWRAWWCIFLMFPQETCCTSWNFLLGLSPTGQLWADSYCFLPLLCGMKNYNVMSLTIVFKCRRNLLYSAHAIISAKTTFSK